MLSKKQISTIAFALEYLWNNLDESEYKEDELITDPMDEMEINKLSMDFALERIPIDLKLKEKNTIAFALSFLEGNYDDSEYAYSVKEPMNEMEINALAADFAFNRTPRE